MQPHSSDLPLDRLSDAIAELAAHIDAASCRLTDMVVDFDLRGGWALEGAKSCTQWLSWRLGWSRHTASERLRVGHALRQLPVLHEAYAQGRVSYSKMRAITRVALPDTADDWLNIALNSTASQCEKICHQTRAATEAENIVVDNARYDHRQLHTYYDAMGMFVIEGRLPPELGEVVNKALEAALEDLRGERKRGVGATGDADLGEETQEGEHEDSAGSGAREPGSVAQPEEPHSTYPQKLADALVQVAEQSLSGEGRVRSADRYQVVVHVDAAVLSDGSNPGRCELANQRPICAESLRRLTCDGSLVTMLHDGEGNILNVGRKTRTISSGLRRALEARDGGCQFPGCDCQHTDAHHIEHWLDDGETKIENLCLVCRFHHRLLHEGGFGVTLDASGELVFTRQNGSVIPAVSVAPALRREAVPWLLERNHDAGIHVDCETNLSGWDGQRPDYEYICGVMVQKTELDLAQGEADPSTD